MSEERMVIEDERIIPLEEAHAEVERELNVRRRCFARWVTEGRISLFDARERLNRLRGALQVLKKLLDLQPDVPATVHAQQ